MKTEIKIGIMHGNHMKWLYSMIVNKACSHYNNDNHWYYEFEM